MFSLMVSPVLIMINALRSARGGSGDGAPARRQLAAAGPSQQDTLLRRRARHLSVTVASVDIHGASMMCPVRRRRARRHRRRTTTKTASCREGRLGSLRTATIEALVVWRGHIPSYEHERMEINVSVGCDRSLIHRAPAAASLAPHTLLMRRGSQHQ
jgi:hypothetical protein